MFRKLYNQAVLTGRLVPDGPVLIVEGRAALDPTAPDLAFVRTTEGDVTTVYLPGSSLKGGGDTAGVYRVSCEADRLFGSTVLAGRFRVGDARPTAQQTEAANRTEIRYGVAIDRAKQSVKHGPFEQEAVVGGAFAFRAVLENFELWMLSLVLQVFADVHDGFVQVGHAGSFRSRLRLVNASEKELGVLFAALGLGAEKSPMLRLGGRKFHGLGAIDVEIAEIRWTHPRSERHAGEEAMSHARQMAEESLREPNRKRAWNDWHKNISTER